MNNKEQKKNDVTLMSNSPDDSRLSKSFGYITALPSEFLVHFRNGKFREKTSGQGASCFKFFKDTVFIIPTSLKEIVFEAYQLTNDNVDTKIRGMAVYRINDPLKIYKLLNFSNRQSSEQKLAKMIGDLCRSNAKWLVSNMNIVECVRKRKEDIAETLKAEITKVVSDTNTGWGIEILTIDIQDVYIQDEEIFSAMQMIFKAEKLKESKEAELDKNREIEIKQLEMEKTLAELKKENELDKARIDSEIKEKQLMYGLV